MKGLRRLGYETPESEELELLFDESFLASIESEKDPVGGSEPGETDEWGWN